MMRMILSVGTYEYKKCYRARSIFSTQEFWRFLRYDGYVSLQQFILSIYTFFFLLEFETPNEDSKVDEDQNIAPEITVLAQNDSSDNSDDDEELVGNTARYRKIKLT